jgi:hypothetical protein
LIFTFFWAGRQVPVCMYDFGSELGNSQGVAYSFVQESGELPTRLSTRHVWPILRMPLSALENGVITPK